MDSNEYRLCPECHQGQVEIRQLSEGCQCTYCRKLIEIDFAYSSGIPVLLALIVGLSFNNDIDWLGFLCTALLVFFTAGYRTVVSRFIPIKHYGDSD